MELTPKIKDKAPVREPFIDLGNELPGIRGLMAYRPDTAAVMGALANVLLRDNEGLTMAERELIATHVSYLNDCFYCHHSHGEIACIYLGGNRNLVDQVRLDYLQAPVSDKLKALLGIAAKVQQSGKAVTKEDIAIARVHGATDRDIHDTVLIAAAFCMFNRYVDGLSSRVPDDMSSYPLRAQQIVETGYGNHILTKQKS